MIQEVHSEMLILAHIVSYFYKQNLQKLHGLTFQDELPESFSNRWLTTILIDPEISNGINREDIRLKLAEENIESRPVWKPMHLQPVFKDAPYFGGMVSEEFFRNGLCLPSGSNLTHNDLIRVCQDILFCIEKKL